MKTTHSRIFASAALILLASLLAIGVSFQILVRDYLTKHTISDLRDDAQQLSTLATAYQRYDALLSDSFVVNLSSISQVSDTDVVVCDAGGTILLCSDSPLGCQHQGMTITNQEYLRRVLRSGSEETGKITGLYKDSRYMVAMPFHDAFNEPAGIVIVSTPTKNIQSILTRISNIFLSVSLLAVLLAVIFMIITVRIQARPLRQIATAANAFGHGNLKARVNIHSAASQEVQDLALAFNNMAASLEKSEEQRQEFVANISHELKTPMTTIGGYVDGMLDGTLPPERHAHYMQLVSAETKRLSRLVQSMLEISRIQSQDGIPEVRKSRFDVNECAGLVLITFEQKILAKKLNVQVQMPEHPAYTFACQDSITQVIYNLVDNAVKFCPQEGDLELAIRLSPNKIFVSVSNSGPTVPPEELPLLFDRFHKTDKSRTENREGWGLGLYIVKSLVCAHGEDISVTSQNGTTRFTFTLPLVT